MKFISLIFNISVLLLFIWCMTRTYEQFKQKMTIEQINTQLKNEKFTLVGSSSCGWSTKQLKELECDWNDVDKFTIVDCKKNPSACSEQFKNIRSFPTWVNTKNGKTYAGFRNLNKIQEMLSH